MILFTHRSEVQPEDFGDIAQIPIISRVSISRYQEGIPADQCNTRSKTVMH